MRKKLSYITLGILVIGLALGINQVNQLQNNQDIRNRAATPNGVVTLSLVPQTQTLAPGQIIPVSMQLDTKGKAIGVISFRITYAYTGTTPQLDITDSKGNQVTSLAQNPALSELSYEVKSVTRINGVVTIDFSAASLDTNGFTTSSPVTLTTFYLKANAVSVTPITFTFDPNHTIALQKSNNTDILLAPVDGVYQVQPQTTNTPTPIPNTPTAKPTRVITPLPITPTLIPTIAVYTPTPIGPTPTFVPNGDTEPPYIILMTGPSDGSSTNSTAFCFPAHVGDNSNGIVWERIAFDSTTFSEWTTDFTNCYRGIADGPHTFSIQLRDQSGNMSAVTTRNFTVVSQTSFTFGFKLQGITKANVSKIVVVAIAYSDTGAIAQTDQIQVVSDANGVFHPVKPIAISSSNISVGTEGTVFVKEGSYLRRKFGNITFQAGKNIAPSSWDSIELKAGDFTNQNNITIVSLGAFLRFYTQLQTPVNSDTMGMDVDADGFLTIKDIGFALQNYVALENPGD